jgi:hypothetical protein
MPLNNLFPRGTRSEVNLVENLIIESIRMYGNEWFYIPRVLVAPDQIFGEDNLSKFKNAYMIECYLDNIDNFGGQGAFISKFGLNIEEQGQLTIAKRRWEELAGQYGKSIIPSRPTEGDLMYFPMTDGLFEIKFVEHQSPFYQLGQLNVWKLKVESFQYSSERIETDLTELNELALGMTFDITEHSNPGEANPLYRDGRQNSDFDTAGNSVLNFDENNPFGN